MLVLSRKINEAIYIGDNIKITLVDIRGDKCRLGFEAPTDVVIDREEVFIAKQDEKRGRSPCEARNVQHAGT